jgi:hypothetical protein
VATSLFFEIVEGLVGEDVGVGVSEHGILPDGMEIN